MSESVWAPRVVSPHVVEFANGQRVTFEGLREDEPVRRLLESGTPRDELFAAYRLVYRNLKWGDLS